MALGFFDGDTRNASPEAVRRKRELVARILSGRAPRNVGEGLQAIGHGLTAAVLGSRADAMDREGNAQAQAVRQGFFGGGAPAMAGGDIRPTSPIGGDDTYTGAPRGLFSSESGGRFGAQNDVMGAGGKRGHFGRVQFGQARLEEAMNAGAIPRGTTPQQFMASPDLQRAAERWHFADIDNSIRRMGIDTSGRQTIQGVPITRDGLVAVAHLGGTRGMQRFVETGGRYNPRDANRTSLMDYFTRMGGRPGTDRGDGMDGMTDAGAAGMAAVDMGAPAPVPVAETETDVQALEAQMAQQAAPDMFSPVPMGGGFNPFVPRDAMQADAPAPASQEAQMIAAPMPPQRPADLAPVSPFLPPEMRQPMPDVRQGTEQGGVGMYDAMMPAQASQMAAASNPFVRGAMAQAQAPAPVAASATGGAGMAGAAAPAGPNGRMAALAALLADPWVSREEKQFALAQVQQQQAMEQQQAQQARAQQQNDAAADALGIDRRLTGNQTILSAAAKAQLDRRSGQTRRSLQPVFGTDAQGNTVMLQPGEDGTAVQTKLPDGVRVASGVERIDAGTKIILQDKRTGQIVGEIPKDIAGAAREGVIGKDQGERVVNAPGEQRTAEQMLGTIGQVRSHPGRDAWGATGMLAGAPLINRGVAGTTGRDFVALVEQMQGQAFLQAFESLKGGGQITETEGKKATDAIARLDRTQSREGFDKALKDIEDVLQAARDRAARRIRADGSPAPATPPPATSGPRVMRYNPATGALE